MKAKEYAWCFLLQNGKCGKWSYYGGDFENRPQIAKKCLEEILQVGVNWEKTREPSDGQESEFIGTFAEETKYVNVLEGALVLNNGERYNWGSHSPKMNVFEMLEYLNAHPSFEMVVRNKLNEMQPKQKRR